MNFLLPHRGFILGLISLCSLVWGTNSYARSEYEVKAAYLYNFIKFVVWEKGVSDGWSQINLCLLGKDPFEGVIDPIQGKSIQGKPINLIRIDDVAGIDQCNVVFVSHSEKKLVDSIVDRAVEIQALTVSDIEDFAKNGGIIGLVQVGNVIRFEINLVNARKSELGISSKLLELAQEVYQ